ncbi:hypothetical protein PVAND_004876 [Polypedilum vanderplanki]|uniref:protein-tyrosine-phosphatase n=1 Tax=Polypedilum vanderplanki TaxID=319348 RepID=A0A9J6BYG8_POLVA|nr:hypothetical protein PVAND_004876 [Polypedilum vanderplanki]
MKLKILLIFFVLFIICECQNTNIQNENAITNSSVNNVSYNDKLEEEEAANIPDEKSDKNDSTNAQNDTIIHLAEITTTTSLNEISTATSDDTLTTLDDTTTTVMQNFTKLSDGKETTSTFEKSSLTYTVTNSTTTETTTTETIVTTTSTETSVTIPPDNEGCTIINLNHTLDNQNYLTINWEINDNESCKSSGVSIIVNKTYCNNVNCGLIQSNINIFNLTYTFNTPLISCATYNYSIMLSGTVNGTTVNKSEEFTTNTQYKKVENLTATDEEDIENPGKLITTISWNYEYLECKTTSFIVRIAPNDQTTSFPPFIQNKTSDYEIILNILPACLSFKITVYPENDDSLITSIDYAAQRVNPTNISDFKASQDLKRLDIDFTWNHPQYGIYCIKYYIIEITSEFQNETRKINSTLTSYTLKDIVSCSEYYAILSTKSDDEDQEETTSIKMETTTETNEESTKMSTTTRESPTNSISITPIIKEGVTTDFPFIVIEQNINTSYTTLPRTFGQRPKSPSLINSTETTLTLNSSADEPKNKCSIDLYKYICRDEEQNKVKEVISTISIVTIEGLEAYTIYNCTSSIRNNDTDTDWSDESFGSENLRTEEGTPNPPQFRIDHNSITKNGFDIVWDPPTQPKGKIKSYTIYIKFAEFNYFNPSYCNKSFDKEFHVTIQEEEKRIFTFKFGEPSSKYQIQMKVANGAKESAYSEPHMEEDTLKIQSDPVKDFIIIPNEVKVTDEEYNKKIKLQWSYPCQANDNIHNFTIIFYSSKQDFIEIKINDRNQTQYYFDFDKLEPDIEYNIQIYAFTDFGTGKITNEEFTLKPGFPEVNVEEGVMPKIVDTSTVSVKIKISDEIFESKVGRITEIALLVAELNCGNDIKPEKDFLFNDKSKEMTYKKAIEYSCIPQYHSNIILERSDEEVTIGTDSCEDIKGLCNGYLKPGTSYALTFRIYTSTGFADTKYIEIKTNREVPVLMISIIVLSLLCVVFFVGFYISYKRTRDLRNTAIDSYDRKDIAVQNFPAYYREMITNESEKIKDEYKAIQFFSENLDKTCIASKANEKLNRYANISPYDSNRVVLNEDEFENDYINASYVNGYYHSKEYVAAQGPKPTTSFDFWRMVLQHKCESIVMLTSLVENNKVKCHEYFPKLNGHVKFDNIQIKCVEEQKHPNYVRRILEVEKNDVKMSVKHYFFSKWPDHSSPNNPNDLIDFIKIVRSERERPDNTFIVHCSAGVGRTGTFIALDIMMQRIKKEAKINIFDLVKQLRFQRMKMVQTIDQYTFLYASAFELTNKTRPNVIRNLISMFEEFDITKKLRINLRESNESIIKKNDNESTL